jgi:signal transduction histidine kinase
MANIDKTQIKQVFLNLFNNALDAMPDGGTLKIEASSSENWLHISVRDTGTGVLGDISEKIFDPFFTTKPEKKGTGIGLSITHVIIERHGGSIELESEVDKGSNFIIQLPLEEEGK